MDKKPRFTIPYRCESEVLIWTFPNLGEVRYDSSAAPENLRGLAVLNGFKQKLADTMAGCLTLEEKYTAMTECRDRLNDGNWNAPRDGTSAPVGGMLWEAMREVRPGKWENLEQFREWAESRAAARSVTVGKYLAGLRKVAEVAAVIERLEAARGTPTVDLSDLDE